MWVARTVAFAELCKVIKKIVGQDEIVCLILGILFYFKFTIGYSFRTALRFIGFILHTAFLPTLNETLLFLSD